MSTVLLESLSAWWPEVILSTGAIMVVLLGVWGKRTSLTLTAAWLFLAASAIALWSTPAPSSARLFFGLIVCDPFSLVFRWLALATSALVIVMIMGSREVEQTWHGEYLGLILFVTLGLMVMAEANHLLMAYVAMELVSLSSYVLV